MKIGLPGISPDAAAGRAPAAADGALTALNWRRALEQAQWQLTGHDRPAVEKPAAAQTAASSGERSTPAFESRAAAAVSADDDRPTPARASRQGSSSMSADPARLPDGHALGPRSAIPASTSLGSSPQGATALGIDAAKALVEQCVQWCTRFPETRWLPVSVHVRVDGSMLGVTLRDVRISAREAQEIHHRLRERLAAMGFELQELTINGHVVVPDSAA